MILLIGEGKNESMSKKILKALQDKCVDVIWIDQNTLPIENKILLYPENGKLKGNLLFHDEVSIDIEEFEAIYSRTAYLNVDRDLDQSQTEFMQSERFITLESWLENTDALVVNPIKSQRSNGSKLYQNWIVKQYGFKIPNCLLTNNPAEAKAFIEQNKDVGTIYKSASGERSVVSRVDDEDIQRLNNLAFCPSLFQRYVEGTDIRIHTLATGEIFATEIVSEKSDYRYDSERSLKPIEIPEALKKVCVNLTCHLGLYLSGIDTRVTPQGDYYCFEVNPSPAFGWYEDQTDQPISVAVAELLTKGKALKQSNLVERKY